jgi:hypothetical protein
MRRPTPLAIQRKLHGIPDIRQITLRGVYADIIYR